MAYILFMGSTDRMYALVFITTKQELYPNVTTQRSAHSKPSTKQKSNHTPNKQKGSKYKAKTQAKSSGPVLVKKLVGPVNEYLCKDCTKPVVKQPCGSTTTTEKTKHSLGVWRCPCGGKKVTVKRIKVAAEGKVAA